MGCEEESLGVVAAGECVQIHTQLIVVDSGMLLAGLPGSVGKPKFSLAILSEADIVFRIVKAPIFHLTQTYPQGGIA